MHITLYQGKNNEIRRMMEKQSLRVNRLIRMNYGPFTLGLVPNPGDLAEIKPTPWIKQVLGLYYNKKAKDADALKEKLMNQKKAA
jgi:23S rRNA pseudouridine2605 synthase